MNRIRRFFVIATVLLVGLAFTGCQSGSHSKTGASGKQKVTVALDWTPNTNHTGLFLANDLGYFAEENLEVEFVTSDMAFIEMVGAGKAQFGIAAQEQVLQARAASGKVPVVAIAAIMQHNTSGFISKKSANIKSPKDFEGKTYSGWGTELELAFLKHVVEQDGGDFSKVKIINQTATDSKASLETEADFMWIYYGWDGVRLELENYPFNFIDLKSLDANMDFYSPVIIANEKTLKEDPELARRFLRAAQKGYLKAISDPQLGADSVLKQAGELDKNLVLHSQKWVNDKYVADAPRWGEMSLDRWRGFYQWMRQHGLLESDINPEDAFTNEYLS